MHIAVLATALLVASCADKKPVSETGEPIQIIEFDGNSYRLAAGKANASDLSIELSYEVRGGVAHIDAVTIDGVEYRSDCSAPEPPEQLPPGGDGPVYVENCADGVGVRDIDFICEGGTPTGPPNPSADQIRLKVEGNEDYLRQRFENAFDVHVPVPYSVNESTGSVGPTYNLSDGKDDFFRIEIKQKARYSIASTGDTDTWGDLYLDGKESIKPIVGSGSYGSNENFGFDNVILEPGTYYLRVSPETDDATGTYGVSVASFLLEEDE